MSETIEFEEPTRQPRQRSERTMSDTGPDALDLAVAGEEHLSPEQALANAQEMIAQKDAQLAAEREGRNRAEREAQRAGQMRLADRGAVIAAETEAATTALSHAEAAYRAAREAGDIDAEIKAQRALSSATARLERAKMEGSNLRQAPQQQVQPNASADYSPESLAWIDRNPRFKTDMAFRQTMMNEHARIVQAGVVANSPMYFQMLDQKAAEIDGRGGQQSNPDLSGNMQRDPAFSGAPPSRVSTSSVGTQRIQTALGPVSLIRGANGRVEVSIPEGLKPAFEENARINGMKLGAYARGLVQVALDHKTGRGVELAGEGAVYR